MTNVQYSTLEASHTPFEAYRYDLEADIRWDLAEQPGIFASPEYLAGMGVPVAQLIAMGLYDTYQWLYALHVVEDFVELESNVIQWVYRGSDALPGTERLDALAEEELKHIRTFRRYRAPLMAQRPALADEAVRLIREMRPSIGFERPDALDEASWHYLVWLEIMAFEDYSIYLYRELEGVGGVQPTWLDMHRVHAQEEEEHVCTDVAYIAALPLTEEQRLRWSKQFMLWLMARYKEKFQAPMRLLHQLEPRSQSIPLGKPPKAFFDALLRHPAFAATRSCAPYIEWMASR